jgi:hypothetical protein
MHMSTETRADIWAAALTDTAHHIKAIEDAGGTVSGLDMTFPPGTDVPAMSFGLKLPRPLDGVTLKHGARCSRWRHDGRYSGSRPEHAEGDLPSHR